MAASKEVPEFRIITIGASAGGYPAVVKILSALEASIPAAILVVVHGAFKDSDALISKLERKTKLKISLAEDNKELMPGNAYLSVPDKHLLIREGRLHLAIGPKENLFRPAIDVLFRSAAVNFGNRCIGVLLSGRLNDGTAGLVAIKKCGGKVVVQDPVSAAFPDMPRYALSVVTADSILEADKIASELNDLVHAVLPETVPIPEHLERENQLAWQINSQVETEEQLGDQVAKSCPSCGGPLWELNDEETGFPRYRCHVGHAFSREALLASQNDSLEKAMWISLRTLEEKHSLMERMMTDYKERGLNSMVRSYLDKLEEVKTNIESIRRIMEISEE